MIGTQMYLQFTFWLSLAGVFFAGYLSLHRLIKKECAFNEPCPYFLGLPACWYGLGMFLALFLSVTAGIAEWLSVGNARSIILGVSFIGILFAGFYVFQEFFEWFRSGMKRYTLVFPTCAYGLVFYVAIFVLSLVVVFSSSVPLGNMMENAAFGFDPKNATFVVDGTQVTLRNGVSEMEQAPGSASKIVTRYFGNEAMGDLNGDGVPDTAFLITQETGGSGTFFYVVLAFSEADGYKTTNAVFMGDRVAPQATDIAGGAVEVNYADRKPDEPMTAAPSVGKTLRLRVAPNGTLGA